MNRPNNSYPFTLVMVEGDTEVLFYNRIKSIYFQKYRVKIINLEGNWNIDKKILDKSSAYLTDHPDIKFVICICIDRDSRSGKAPINMELIKSELNCYPNIKSSNIRLYEAVQDIESWFFHDIKGIYKFLQLPQRNLSRNVLRKYRPVEKLNHQYLSRLFRESGKEYRKGYASENFINNLDIEKIRSNSKVLNDFCVFIDTIY